jgi:hypothetical protein
LLLIPLYYKTPYHHRKQLKNYKKSELTFNSVLSISQLNEDLLHKDEKLGTGWGHASSDTALA